jgi:hypothetical protein
VQRTVRHAVGPAGQGQTLWKGLTAWLQPATLASPVTVTPSTQVTVCVLLAGGGRIRACRHRLRVQPLARGLPPPASHLHTAH